MGKLRAGGFHIYAGGFTLGVKKHFKIMGHLEEGGAWGRAIGKHVQATKDNLPRVPIYLGSDTWPLDEWKDLDMLYGNPPCAAWSAMGPRAFRGTDAWKTDGRVSFAKIGFALQEKLEPKVWVWESVMGAYRQGRELVDEFTKSAIKRGYDVSYFLHNGKWFGLPQHRERFFMVVSNIEIDWKPPAFDKPMTVSEVFKTLDGKGDQDVLSLGNLPKSFIKSVKQGEPLRTARDPFVAANPDIYVPKTGFAYRRMKADREAYGLVGAIYIHPTKNRYLTIEENLALCGYPTTYKLTGRPGQKVACIAQAVMPPTGEWIAKTVARSVRRGKPATSTIREVDYRRPLAGSSGIRELEKPKGRALRWKIKDWLKSDDGGREQSEDVSSSPSEPSAGARVSPSRPSSSPRRNTDKKAAAKRGERGGCGYRIREMLLEGKGNDQILTMIRKEFPWSKAGPSDISWNKSKLAKQGNVA